MKPLPIFVLLLLLAVLQACGVPDPPLVEERAADDYPPGAATTLPEGYEIWVVSNSKTKEWKLPPSVYGLQLRTPDGPVDIRVMEDGRIAIQSFGLQAEGGMGVVDRVVRFEFKVLPPPAKPE